MYLFTLSRIYICISHFIDIKWSQVVIRNRQWKKHILTEWKESTHKKELTLILVCLELKEFMICQVKWAFQFHHRNYRSGQKSISYNNSTSLEACKNVIDNSYYKCYNDIRDLVKRRSCVQMSYPAVYLVAAFAAIILAFSALLSDSFFSTKPSPLHSEQMPEPPQSSQSFVKACRY